MALSVKLAYLAIARVFPLTMSSSAVFSPAGQPELIRANQKDHQYLYVFRKQFITAIESIFGDLAIEIALRHSTIVFL